MFTLIWSFLGCTMFALICSFFVWKEEPLPSPPPVTITGVRIPADGTPAHLLSLTTTSASGATDSFLFHVPDLRQYWNTEQAWIYRDLHRLDLQHQHYLWQSHHLQQREQLHLQQWYHLLKRQRRRLLEPYHLLQRQRQYVPQQHHLLHEHHLSCIGSYYVFYSFALDDLPKNSSVPAWISDIGDIGDVIPPQYWGDVFLVKMAPYEYGEYGWAVYEDIAPEFLDLLIEGPLDGWALLQLLSERHASRSSIHIAGRRFPLWLSNVSDPERAEHPQYIT
jgi:hypothetical protein